MHAASLSSYGWGGCDVGRQGNVARAIGTRRSVAQALRSPDGLDTPLTLCGSIRLKVLKIGAQITISVRRVKIAIASSSPGQQLFRSCSQTA